MTAPRPAGPARFTLTSRQPLVGEVDENARLSWVPATLTTKGMFIADLVHRAGEAEAKNLWPKLQAPPSHGKYQAFLDYPFHDALQWLHVVARKEHPRVSLLEGMRRLGRDTVKVFLASKAGRVVKAMTAGPRESLLIMPQMWKISDPGNQVDAEAIDAATVRFEIHGYPGWLDCGLFGTLEQVVLNHECEPTLDVELHSYTHATIAVHWTKR